MFLSILSLSACTKEKAANVNLSESPSATTASHQTISAAVAKQMLDTEAEYILLDVRSPEEFAEQHIAGALLIPDYEIATRAQAELPDLDALILIYCRSGRRSALAAAALVELGYTNVYDFGGIIDWPYETIGG